MRYFIQFLIPALILIAAVYAATRRRRRAVVVGSSNETGMFIFIVVTGSLVALGVMFAIGYYLE